MHLIEVGDMSIAVMYASLVIMNFKLAEWVYDNMINEMFHRNQKLLHDIFKYCRKVLESTLYRWFSAIKEIVIALVISIIPNLPTVIRMPFDFLGITSYLEK